MFISHCAPAIDSDEYVLVPGNKNGVDDGGKTSCKRNIFLQHRISSILENDTIVLPAPLMLL